MSCMYPITTALVTGTWVKAKKYAISPRIFAATATYTSADSCRLSILKLALFVIPPYTSAVRVTRIALTARVCRKSEF